MESICPDCGFKRIGMRHSLQSLNCQEFGLILDFLASNCSRTMFFRTFPTDVRGSISKNSMRSGTLWAAKYAAQWERTSSGVSCACGFLTTTAVTDSSRVGSGRPHTQTSATPSNAAITDSTSEVEMFNPERLIMSL